MDADRFDTLTRSLTAVGSRRRALGAALSSALGLLGLADPDAASAAKSPKCKRKPGECERCDRGKCERINGEKRCKAGKIKPKAFGTPCSIGSCQNGACIAAPPPPCRGLDTPCTADVQCCSGICDTYSEACEAVRFGCDPNIAAHCPAPGLCCEAASEPGEFTCRTDPLNNPRSCGTTCENLKSCSANGAGQAAQCRGGACCCPAGETCGGVHPPCNP